MFGQESGAKARKSGEIIVVKGLGKCGVGGGEQGRMCKGYQLGWTSLNGSGGLFSRGVRKR